MINFKCNSYFQSVIKHVFIEAFFQTYWQEFKVQSVTSQYHMGYVNFVYSSLSGFLILPFNLATFKSNAFYSCGKFNRELKIPEKTKMIDSSAFCYWLIIPKTIRLIDKNKFYNCSKFNQ